MCAKILHLMSYPVAAHQVDHLRTAFYENDQWYQVPDYAVPKPPLGVPKPPSGVPKPPPSARGGRKPPSPQNGEPKSKRPVSAPCGGGATPLPPSGPRPASAPTGRRLSLLTQMKGEDTARGSFVVRGLEACIRAP